MPKPKVEYNIDLQCSLCPKNPTFSDVSHLLTHISSKGHLAHRFKLQIRSQNEPEAKNILDVFDFWYRTSNLDALLSERLAAKDQKKTKKSRVSTGKSGDSPIKQEKIARPLKISAPEAPMYRAPGPAMQIWSGVPTINRTPSTTVNEWESSVYSTPTTRRAVPNFPRAETPVDDKVDPNLTTPWKPTATGDDEEDNKKAGEKLSDSAKLKGVLWPGMDLFDAATPLMKRQRNQKKDGGIMETMIATSLGVEPAEISYHANGEFRASRDIFGPLSTENSPTRSPTPKRRRATRKAQALNDLSVNAPRLRAPRGRKGAPGQDPQKPGFPVSNHAGHLFNQSTPTLNPLAVGLSNGRYQPSAEEDEEFRLTIGDLLPQEDRKRRNFTIFQEAPQISPGGRTETPLEDHGFDYPNHGLPTYGGPAMPSGGFQNSPTPVAKPAFFGFGKENGHMDIRNHYQARRTLSDSHVIPSQVFYDNPFNPLYNHAYGRPFAYSTQYMANESKSPGSFQPNMLGASHFYKHPAGQMSRFPESQASDASTKNGDHHADAFGA